MKEEIEANGRQLAIDHLWHPDMMETKRVGREIINAYRSGAEWMLEQYQGITPDTVKEMLEALKRIKAWEMPDTGKTWDDGTKMSYGAAYGSNGERDVIKGIARRAIAKAEQGLKSQQHEENT